MILRVTRVVRPNQQQLSPAAAAMLLLQQTCKSAALLLLVLVAAQSQQCRLADSLAAELKGQLSKVALVLLPFTPEYKYAADSSQPAL